MENIIENYSIHNQAKAETIAKRLDSVQETDLIVTSLSLSPALIAKCLGVVTAFLIIASSVAVLTDYMTGRTYLIIHKLVSLFYVELELNAPAFFSTLLLLSAFALLSVISISKQKHRASFRFEWFVLTLGFLFMAFDETASIHERLIEPMRSIIGEQSLGVLYFAWVVPAIVLVVCLGIFFLRFLINLPRRTAIYFLVAAAMYLGGALGLEMAEGWHSEINGKENFLYIAMTTLEETLEMTGTIVFIWALLEYIADLYKTVQFRFIGLPQKD